MSVRWRLPSRGFWTCLHRGHLTPAALTVSLRLVRTGSLADVPVTEGIHLENHPEHRGYAVCPEPRPRNWGPGPRSQPGSFWQGLSLDLQGLGEPSCWGGGALVPATWSPGVLSWVDSWPLPSPGVASRPEGCTDSAGCQDGRSCVCFYPEQCSCALHARCRDTPKNMVCGSAAEALRPLPESGLELRFSSSALKTLWFSVSPGPAECTVRVLSLPVIPLLRHGG